MNTSIQDCVSFVHLLHDKWMLPSPDWDVFAYNSASRIDRDKILPSDEVISWLFGKLPSSRTDRYQWSLTPQGLEFAIIIYH